MRSGSAQPFISNTALGQTQFLMPVDALASHFCRVVRDLRLRQENISIENEVLSELRDALLLKLIPGELQIPDAEKFLKEAGI